jgi:hypothetical protein
MLLASYFAGALLFSATKIVPFGVLSGAGQRENHPKFYRFCFVRSAPTVGFI